jgi:hypothetical protein
LAYRVKEGVVTSNIAWNHKTDFGGFGGWGGVIYKEGIMDILTN